MANIVNNKHPGERRMIQIAAVALTAVAIPTAYTAYEAFCLPPVPPVPQNVTPEEKMDDMLRNGAHNEMGNRFRRFASSVFPDK